MQGLTPHEVDGEVPDVELHGRARGGVVRVGRAGAERGVDREAAEEDHESHLSVVPGSVQTKYDVYDLAVERARRFASFAHVDLWHTEDRSTFVLLGMYRPAPPAEDEGRGSGRRACLSLTPAFTGVDSVSRRARSPW